jgi:endoglucanase
MKKMLLILLSLALLLSVSRSQVNSTANAPEISPSPGATNTIVNPVPSGEEAPVPQFQNGDRICFIGDSITQGGTYYAQILLYYATRFPDRKIVGYNCGINGDSAGGVLILKRPEWDILPHQPTVATIMLGMNDVGINYYGKNLTGPQIENTRKWPLLGFPKNMEKISDILTAAHCRIIYLTPSIYDQTGNQARPSHFGANDALGILADDDRKLAAQFHGGLVDFHTPMTRINAEQQAKDPSFTLIGPDRIHPGAEGNLVMAYEFLKAQQVPSIVSNTAIDAATASIVKQDNCQITDLKSENGAITFTSKENALPFPLAPEELKKLEPLVPWTEDLNQELLTVANLPAGNYELSIDGQVAQECTADELKNGINLATNANTPQAKQAANVAALVWQRRGLDGSLRIIASVHSILYKANISFDDEVASRKLLQDTIDNYKKNGKTAPHIEIYLKYTPEQRKQFVADAAALTDKIYVENQPQPHTFAIRPK